MPHRVPKGILLPLFLSRQAQCFPNLAVCIHLSGFCTQEVLLFTYSYNLWWFCFFPSLFFPFLKLLLLSYRHLLRALRRKPLPLWGFPLCFVLLPSSPAECLEGGTLVTARPVTLNAGPGFLGALAETEKDSPGCSSSAPVPVPRMPQAFRRWPSCSRAWDRRSSTASSWGTSLQGHGGGLIRGRGN